MVRVLRRQTIEFTEELWPSDFTLSSELETLSCELPGVSGFGDHDLDAF